MVQSYCEPSETVADAVDLRCTGLTCEDSGPSLLTVSSTLPSGDASSDIVYLCPVEESSETPVTLRCCAESRSAMICATSAVTITSDFIVKSGQAQRSETMY